MRIITNRLNSVASFLVLSPWQAFGFIRSYWSGAEAELDRNGHGVRREPVVRGCLLWVVAVYRESLEADSGMAIAGGRRGRPGVLTTRS